MLGFCQNWIFGQNLDFWNSVRCQARRNLPGESLLMKVGWGREREQLFKICTTYIGGCWASPRQAEVPPSKPSVPPVRRSLVVDTPFSKHFLGFLRLISRKDRRPRVEDFMVVNSYLSAWCPGCVGPPPIFIQQGIKLWNAFRKLSDRKAYKIGFKQLQEKTFLCYQFWQILTVAPVCINVVAWDSIVEKYLWFPKVSWVVFSVPTSNIEIWSWCNFRWASAQQSLCWQVHNELYLENSQCLEMSFEECYVYYYVNQSYQMV